MGHKAAGADHKTQVWGRSQQTGPPVPLSAAASLTLITITMVITATSYKVLSMCYMFSMPHSSILTLSLSD